MNLCSMFRVIMLHICLFRTLLVMLCLLCPSLGIGYASDGDRDADDKQACDGVEAVAASIEQLGSSWNATGY